MLTAIRVTSSGLLPARSQAASTRSLMVFKFSATDMILLQLLINDDAIGSYGPGIQYNMVIDRKAVIRAPGHNDAVSMYLIQYVRGQAQCISREVVTNCFVTGCRIWVRYENGILSAKAWTVTEPTVVQQERGYARGVELTAEVGRRENAENTGLLIWHTGSLGTENWRNTTMLHGVSILYF